MDSFGSNVAVRKSVRVESDTSGFEQQVALLRSQLDSSTAQETELQKELEGLRAEVTNATAEDAERKREVQGLQTQLADNLAEDAALKTSVEGLRSQLAVSAAEDAAAKKEVQGLRSQLAEANEQSQRLRSLEQENKSLQEKLDQAESEGAAPEKASGDDMSSFRAWVEELEKQLVEQDEELAMEKVVAEEAKTAPGMSRLKEKWER